MLHSVSRVRKHVLPVSDDPMYDKICIGVVAMRLVNMETWRLRSVCKYFMTTTGRVESYSLDPFTHAIEYTHPSTCIYL